jgi:hypothetical protein
MNVPIVAKVVAPIALALGGILYVALRPSDEARIKEQIAKLASLVRVTEDDAQTNPIGRMAHVSDALGTLVDRDVRVNVPDLPSLGSGRQPLAELITSEPHFLRTLEADFAHVEIKLDEPHTSAMVGLTARVKSKEIGGSPREDERAVDLRFAKQDGAWIVTTITVWAPGDARAQ